MRLRTLSLVGVLAAVAATAGAQDWWGRWGGGFAISRMAPRFATPESFDGGFNYCRVFYTSDRREDGGSGWRTDYPDADTNFSIRLAELTKTRVSRQPSGAPNHLVVRLTDEALYQCPFLFIEDAGTVSFTEEEVLRLRDYFLKGGFMWSDDFWGEAAWEQWVGELARVLPPGEFPITEITADDPMFRSMFDVTALPQVPSIQFWFRNGGSTSERGSESAVADYRVIRDSQGRVMVLMTHDNDVADAWEREGEDPRFFTRFSPIGYAVGIDVMMYAMTH